MTIKCFGFVSLCLFYSISVVGVSKTVGWSSVSIISSITVRGSISILSSNDGSGPGIGSPSVGSGSSIPYITSGNISRGNAGISRLTSIISSVGISSLPGSKLGIGLGTRLEGGVSSLSH